MGLFLCIEQRGNEMANEKVDAQVLDSLVIENTVNISGASARAMANLFQHQTNHARRLEQIAEGHTAKALDRFASIDVVEAAATSKLFKGEADSSVNSLLGQLSSGQIGSKIAASTPGHASVELAKLGASVASIQAQIGGLVALLQQGIKGAQTTPPVTA